MLDQEFDKFASKNVMTLSNNNKDDPVNVVEDFVSEVLESEFTKNEIVYDQVNNQDSFEIHLKNPFQKDLLNL